MALADSCGSPPKEKLKTSPSASLLSSWVSPPPNMLNGAAGEALVFSWIPPKLKPPEDLLPNMLSTVLVLKLNRMNGLSPDTKSGVGIYIN